jgi:acetyl-CoA carboxylase alpha subunit
LLDACLWEALSSVRDMSYEDRIARRYEKFRAMGNFENGKS